MEDTILRAGCVMIDMLVRAGRVMAAFLPGVSRSHIADIASWGRCTVLERTFSFWEGRTSFVGLQKADVGLGKERDKSQHLESAFSSLTPPCIAPSRRARLAAPDPSSLSSFLLRSCVNYLTRRAGIPESASAVQQALLRFLPPHSQARTPRGRSIRRF